MYVILPLAHEYQIEKLVLDCEQFLLKSPSVAHLVIAERFNLKTLEDACVQHLEKIKYKDIIENEDYENISGLDKPIVRILQKKNEKMRQCLVKIVNEVAMFVSRKSVKKDDLLATRTCILDHSNICAFKIHTRLSGNTSSFSDCKKCLFDVVHLLLMLNENFM